MNMFIFSNVYHVRFRQHFTRFFSFHPPFTKILRRTNALSPSGPLRAPPGTEGREGVAELLFQLQLQLLERAEFAARQKVALKPRCGPKHGASGF